MISSGLHAKIVGVSTKRVQIGDITSKPVERERMKGGKNQSKRKQGRRGKRKTHGKDRTDRKHKNMIK